MRKNKCNITLLKVWKYGRLAITFGEAGHKLGRIGNNSCANLVEKRVQKVHGLSIGQSYPFVLKYSSYDGSIEQKQKLCRNK